MFIPKTTVSVNATHTGAIRPSPKQQDETVREQNTSTEITHIKTENKPAQKPAGLPGLNSPKPKQETGATNQTTLNETEKGIGGRKQIVESGIS
jgi:hypothetical protein